MERVREFQRSVFSLPLFSLRKVILSSLSFIWKEKKKDLALMMQVALKSADNV